MKKIIITGGIVGTGIYLYLKKRIGVKIISANDQEKKINYEVIVGLTKIKGTYDALNVKGAIKQQIGNKTLVVESSKAYIVKFQVLNNEGKVIYQYIHTFPNIGIVPPDYTPVTYNSIISQETSAKSGEMFN
ncbi:hypothetical protein [Lacinutrix sp. Hel_I_90]|uniref:hypothetical protein n=1 Tax=Lacinutrix sp. Hel_I_90 TaxID=1249999 RepID=UPI0005CA4591|nr:hypothetical protein [Lacinutrix sp. Hel_I_90]